jgi:hypothetical protein
VQRVGLGGFTFDEDAAFEACVGADQCDQVESVHGAPAGLGGLDQLNVIASPASTLAPW